ncbi:hypothetical protein Tco_1453956, partial [Tanacetum coccineum]
GNDEDDHNNDHDSRSEGSDQERDSGDDKAQYDSEKELDSEHETDENESGSKSDHDENEEDIKDDEDEVKDEFVKTPSNDSDDEDETKITIKLKKTKVLVTSSSHSSDLAAKFLNFLDIPYTDAKIVSPIDVHVHHEVPSKQTPTLLTIPVLVITDSSPKRSRKDKDEDPFAGSDRGLKKRKTSKDVEPAKGPKAKESQSGSSKGDKSQSKSSRKSVQSEELEFEVADSDMPQDQEENPGNADEEPKENVASKRDWFTKPIQPQEPTNPD